MTSTSESKPGDRRAGDRRKGVKPPAGADRREGQRRVGADRRTKPRG